MLLWLNARFGQTRPDVWTGAAIIAAFVTAGLLAGYVVALGEPIPISLTLGVIGGIVLLNALPMVVWIILIGVLLVSGPLFMFVPALEKAGWLFSILGFFLTGAAILYAAVGRNRFSHRPPAFVGLAIAVLALGLASLTYSDGPMSEGIRAGKRYFQFMGLLFVLTTVPFPQTLVRRWWGFVVVVALLQLPFAVYQRFALVPAREGMPNVVSVDIVVGTMEGSLLGGGSSSVMALLLLFVLSYLLAAYREGLLPMRRLLPLGLIVAAPLVLGEVTLIVVLLPIALAAVYIDAIRHQPLRLALGAMLAIPVCALGGWAYLIINGQPGVSVPEMIEAVIAYNFGQVGYFGGASLNRTSVYTYWLQHQSLADPIGLLFGNGLGSSFGGVNEPNPGHMDAVHSRMYIGLTAASSLLWDLGIAGFLLFFAMFASAARCAWALTHDAKPGFDRAFCRALLAMTLMLIAMVFYSTGPIALPSQQVLTALSLGLIAWRWRGSGARSQRTGATHAA